MLERLPQNLRAEGRGIHALYRARDMGAMLGDPATDAAAQAANVALIQNQLSGALTPAQLATTVSTYTGLSMVQSQSVLGVAASLAAGQVPTWATMAPLVAGGLALLNVAAPVVALVAAAIPILGALVSLITGTDPKCTWNVGGVCFTGNVPWGPSDPKWVTWQQFVSIGAEGLAPQIAGTLFPGTTPPQGGIAWFAFPDYASTIGCELPIIDATIAALQTPSATLGAVPSSGILGVGAQGAQGGHVESGGMTTAVPTDVLNTWLFLRTYYTVWIANAEQAINGHPYAHDADLLVQTVTAWNATHTPNYQYTFQPATVTLADIEVGKASACRAGEDLVNPDVPTFVALLLAGQIDGHDQPPLTINVGSAFTPILATAPPASTPPATGASSGSSTGTAIAIAAGGSAAALLLWELVKHGSSLFGGRRR